MKTLLALTLLLAIISGPAYGSAFCKECHSKDPKIKAMHAALDYDNCWACHKDPGNIRMSDAEKKNRANDPRCMSCHKK